MERMIHLVKVDFGFIDSVLQKYDCDKTRVIAIMQEIQNEYKFLPKDALKYVAEKVGESEAELYGVATFYENFSMNEKGKYIIKVCNGTACHVRKSDDVQEAIYAATGLTFGEQHPDDDEFLSVEKIPLEKAVEMILSGEITDAKTQAAVLKLKLLKDNGKI